MALEFTTSYLTDARAVFRKYKQLAEGAMAQVTDAQLFEVPFLTEQVGESNSIAVIVKHVAGNLRSRWMDFLTTDGEKPWRDRDSEFASARETRESLMAGWDAGWACLFAALEPLTDADLGRTVTIRGEAHSVLQAVNRQMAHYPYHVGQIVWLAKHFQGGNWKSLSIPKGASAALNGQALAGETPASK
jgi:hypothetical protein